MSAEAAPKTWLLILDRVDRGLARMETSVASLVLALTLLISLYALSARALLMPTAEWVLELPMELLVVVSIYGSGALVSKKKHLAVDVALARLPPNTRRLIGLSAELGLAVLCAVLAERTITAAEQASRAAISIPELFHLPSSVPLLVAAGGFALWSGHYWVRYVKGVFSPWK